MNIDKNIAHRFGWAVAQHFSAKSVVIKFDACEPAQPLQQPQHGGVPLYRDDHHLSKQGAQFATQLIVDLL